MGSKMKLNDKTVIFLGSSVTYGSASSGVSFVDHLARIDGVTAVKEAVPGTTLVDDDPKSYISRMKTIDPAIKADAFVCQLSTNDATGKKHLGSLSEGFDPKDFDTHTVAGAIEYVTAYSRRTWDCPVLFYTNPRFDCAEYERMTSLLYAAEKKWGFTVIDLWNDEEINSIPDDLKALYMHDPIHPTASGYRDLWTPVFRKALTELLT
ncbi:MAG: SGNH/GDSL hydrolase family protein [Clostridia bacterium]|nr:SGNH/GDSL hydrolase family protein [Clostridia bacterium]MBQ9879823.1 SGNH/GDSL hydrolase family protein [Clostridia bacterium]